MNSTADETNHREKNEEITSTNALSKTASDVKGKTVLNNGFTATKENEKNESINTDMENNEKHLYDFVMLCDSNRKFININKLCMNRNSKMIPCNTTAKAMEITIDTPRFDVNKGSIINTGVNDVEHLTPEEIINNQVRLVEKAKSTFPNANIILSDITPRNDAFDESVQAINDAIDEKIRGCQNVFHVYNGNLRHANFYHDAKHLSKKHGVPALARNIKRVLRNLIENPIRRDHQRSAQPQTANNHRTRPLQSAVMHQQQVILQPLSVHAAITSDEFQTKP